MRTCATDGRIGRSALQNELIGDFHEEFHNFPERAEDIALSELDASIGTSVNLGKKTTTLVTRMVASIMPAGFNKVHVESYLAGKWGLGPLRQKAVLLHGLTCEPRSRIPSSEEAQTHWDQVISSYSEAYGANLDIMVPKGGTHPEANIAESAPVVSSSVLIEMTRAHKRMAMKQYEALTEYLQGELPEFASKVHDDQLVTELLGKLDLWTAEFSTDFLSGITPMFQPQRIRWYNSWWNNARLGLMEYCRGTAYDNLMFDELAFNEFTHNLCNRSDSELARMARSCYSGATSGKRSTTYSRMAKAIAAAVDKPPVARLTFQAVGPQTRIKEDGKIEYCEAPRQAGFETYPEFLSRQIHNRQGKQHTIRVKATSLDRSRQEIDVTQVFLDEMSIAATMGISFQRKLVLVTGAGTGSIGTELVRILLAGGAKVIVTTHRKLATVAKYYQDLYDESGAKGAQLHLIPFNQASAQDCERLIDHIYQVHCTADTHDLDAIVPLAAGPEAGVEMDQIAASNELAHRLMLTNVLRLLGRVIWNKRQRAIDCHATQILLPFSPNHGTFGGDGLYPESKLGLESLLQRVRSESWSDLLSIAGVRIGWTRSTGLMATHDTVADAMETLHGILTFSAREMGWNMAILLSPGLSKLFEDGLVYADFDGALGSVDNLHKLLNEARQKIKLASETNAAICKQDERERAMFADELGPMRGSRSAARTVPLKQTKKALLSVGFPHLPECAFEEDLRRVKDFADVVVVVGFSELGPWGSARLRWEMESQGRFSCEGYVEMAWLMGLIRYSNGPIKGPGSEHYIGWVDTKTAEPVLEADMETRYGEFMKTHAGLRFMPQVDVNQEPGKQELELLHEVMVEDDLPPFQTSLATAEALQLKHGDKVSVQHIPHNSDTCQVRIRRGATLYIPKSVASSWGTVAGRVPDGWNAANYGIPDDIIAQVDPVTLYAICCTAEAFYSAGITDPLEIFQHIHLSEFGNFIGSSMGGTVKTRHLYRSAYMDQEIQGDTLQDTYINTTAAWINMLLLGATGPIKTPVGACATGVESLDSGVESIKLGKVKMCLVGGYDDLQEEEMNGFARLRATVDIAAELNRGREPAEMSRPTAESRAGFVESHGCGMQLLCRGDIAIEMGLPIYGVVAGSAMAADKIGRSVPAPGQGILAFAKERESGSPPAPLRQALSSWGLGIDDLDVASLHGTSTRANDLNEPDVLCKQMSHLGRTPGSPIWAVCQKSITGHPKAPASAWMLNGCLQMMDSCLVPGNRNADNVDPALQPFHHLCFPTHTVQTRDHVKAFLLTSFGFGQKSGQMIGVAPRFFFSLLKPDEYEGYKNKTKRRQARAERAYLRAMMSNSIVRVKEKPPYAEADAAAIMLDPEARISHDPDTGVYRFSSCS